MTFYHFIVPIIKFFIYLLNGKPEVHGLEHVPTDRPVILAGTHRSYLDPFLVAITIYPDQVSYMAKDSLFEIPVLGWLLKRAGMFSVDRDNPSRQTIKTAVQKLTDEQVNLGIFPSGSRHSTELKGGTAFIQRMSKVDIIPIAIQPTIGIKRFLMRGKNKIIFGEPIKYNPNIKYNQQTLKQIDKQLAQTFDQLDYQLNPDYSYDPAIHQK